jgi:hypothetical protein
MTTNLISALLALSQALLELIHALRALGLV